MGRDNYLGHGHRLEVCGGDCCVLEMRTEGALLRVSSQHLLSIHIEWTEATVAFSASMTFVPFRAQVVKLRLVFSCWQLYWTRSIDTDRSWSVLLPTKHHTNRSLL